MKVFLAFFSFSLFTLLTGHHAAQAAQFREYPIGDAVEKNHLTIAAVYFPAVAMDHSAGGDNALHANHEGMTGLDAKSLMKEKFVEAGKELVHIEADIHASAGNPNGFGVGEWIPYLTIQFKLFRAGEKQALLEGNFMPMIAKDGPHYGTTLRMPGKGKYHLEYLISAPTLARHTDPTTGVAEYWKPFTANYEFEYAGLPK